MASLTFFYTVNPFPKTTFFHASQTQNKNLPRKLSCKGSNTSDSQNSKSNEKLTKTDILNRRNALIKVGGFCGATSIFLNSPSSLAAPAEADVSDCGPTNFPRGGPVGLDCCPPTPKNIINFKPDKHPVLKIRPAAHLVDKKYVEKYSKAISLMRNLPQDDPRNFIQQANVHCAYCDASYHQVGFPYEYQVHGDWLFYAFHRAYLYFFEKILGKLINDPTFALPFWNWDHPDGMYMPTIYTDPSSSLYDPLRNQSHLPPTLLDLSYDGQDVNDRLSPDDLITANLTVMYRQMVTNAKNATMFFGRPYRAGDPAPTGGGSLEAVPHGTVHRWTGDPREPYNIDMGAFFAAARDPIFYAHHGNIDRLWSIWKTLGGKRRDFTDPDYLNASFFFYDENAKPVRITVRDCLDDKKLGYVYQDVDIPWLNYRPRPSESKGTKTSDAVVWPKNLNSTIRTKIERPRKSRSKKEKEEEEEVLVIKLEVMRMDEFHKFDVYINEDDDNPSRVKRINTEYAGSFSMMPMRRSNMMTTNFTLGLTDLIDDLGVDGQDSLEVILVPQSGLDSINVVGVGIEFMS